MSLTTSLLNTFNFTYLFYVVFTSFLSQHLCYLLLKSSPPSWILDISFSFLILCKGFVVMHRIDLWNYFKTYLQKQPPKGVPRKSFSENIQQIYRRTHMPKCARKLSSGCNFLRTLIKSRPTGICELYFNVFQNQKNNIQKI